MRRLNYYRIVCMLLALAAIATGRSQTVEADTLPAVRPVLSAYTLGVGSVSMADTYLSPVTYRGWSLSLGYERMQAMRFNPRRWVMQLGFVADVANGDNRIGNASMWYASLDARWGMMYKMQMPYNITLLAGGSTGIDGGVIYNRRNSNNPASAKFAWSVNVTGMAVWKCTVGRLPVTLSYQPTVALLGLFFSPEYDELYYEIYLGNRSGLVHFGWPGNRFAMTNAVMADLHFGSTSLRVGYCGTILSSEASHLVTNVTTNRFVIGISGEWMSLDTRRRSTSNILSAY